MIGTDTAFRPCSNVGKSGDIVKNYHKKRGARPKPTRETESPGEAVDTEALHCGADIPHAEIV